MAARRRAARPCETPCALGLAARSRHRATPASTNNAAARPAPRRRRRPWPPSARRGSPTRSGASGSARPLGRGGRTPRRTRHTKRASRASCRRPSGALWTRGPPSTTERRFDGRRCGRPSGARSGRRACGRCARIASLRRRAAPASSSAAPPNNHVDRPPSGAAGSRARRGGAGPAGPSSLRGVRSEPPRAVARQAAGQRRLVEGVNPSPLLSAERAVSARAMASSSLGAMRCHARPPGAP